MATDPKDPLAKLPTIQKLDSVDSLIEESMRIARDELGEANPVVKKQLHLLDQVKAYAKGVRKDVEAAATRRDAEHAELNRQIDQAKAAANEASTRSEPQEAGDSPRKVAEAKEKAMHDVRDVPPEPPPAFGPGQSAAKRR